MVSSSSVPQHFTADGTKNRGEINKDFFLLLFGCANHRILIWIFSGCRNSKTLNQSPKNCLVYGLFFFLFHLLSRSKLSDVVEPERRRCNEEKLCGLCFPESSLYQVSRRERKTSSWQLMWRVAVSILSMLSTSKKSTKLYLPWLVSWISKNSCSSFCHAIFLPNERLLGRKRLRDEPKEPLRSRRRFRLSVEMLSSLTHCVLLYQGCLAGDQLWHGQVHWRWV